MEKGDKAAIVCCSNGQATANQDKLQELHIALKTIGLEPVWSDFIYERELVFSGTAKERAKALMDFYRDEEIKVIFDISGGNIANEILPYLDFEVIANSKKQFWGYSDLTTIINAIYAKTGKESVLYQIRNLIYENAETQIVNFQDTVMNSGQSLFQFDYRFAQSGYMKGIVVGGNIRCLLKLAGTDYFPDMNGKILLLEAYGGLIPQMVTYLSQLKQMGVFEKVAGILLGTFTKLKEQHCEPLIVELVKQYAGEKVPIVYTTEIGHGTNSKAIVIGKEMELK